jgi:hypothetical protein
MPSATQPQEYTVGNDSLMTNYMLSQGFKFTNVDAKGNCFFHCLVDQLGENEISKLRDNFGAKSTEYNKNHEFLRALALAPGKKYIEFEYADDEMIETFVKKTGHSVRVFSDAKNAVSTQVFARDDKGEVLGLPAETSPEQNPKINVYLTGQHFISVNHVPINPQLTKLTSQEASSSQESTKEASFMQEVTKAALEYVTKSVQKISAVVTAKFLNENAEAIKKHTTIDERQELIARTLNALYQEKNTLGKTPEAKTDPFHKDFAQYSEVNDRLTEVITSYKDDIIALDEKVAAQFIFADCQKLAKKDPIAAAEAVLHYGKALIKNIDQKELSKTTEKLKDNLAAHTEAKGDLKQDFKTFADRVASKENSPAKGR